MKPRVLIICTGNSMRSQMAEGLLRADLGDQIEVFSAGTNPSFVYPAVIEAMAEIGIDISGHRSKSVTEFVKERLDLVVTVCNHAAECCPSFTLAKKQIHKGYPDPMRGARDDDPYRGIAEQRDLMRVELRALVTRELHLGL